MSSAALVDITPARPSHDPTMSLQVGSTDTAGLKRSPKMAEGEKEAPFQSDTHLAVPSSPRSNHASQTLARLLHGQEKEWEAVAKKEGPLQLLDLPVVVLKEIVKEVTSTNDLTALALTHSALHELATPYIYSRFDIVWPDSLAVSDNRTGVDALTYGLATLVMAQDVFGEAHYQRASPQTYHKCSQCGYIDRCSHKTKSSQVSRKFRRGNNFAQFTRKFSLGNGPADWVQEYLITKESGKMLGTLVALAIGRMRNLEQFVWDMPTGVLRDVWAALASLGDRDDGQPCRLEKVWVRWHNNSEARGDTPSPNLASMNPTLLSTLSPGGHPQSLFQIPPYPRVEFPTFSHLPPLKSLTVLDIDELSYVEEMSILLERSKECVRELRIGVADHARGQSWITMSSRKADRLSASSYRLHGILGVLLAKILEKIEVPFDPNFGLSYPIASSPDADDDLLDSPSPADKELATDRTEMTPAVLRTPMGTLPSVADLNTIFSLTSIRDPDTTVLNVSDSLAESPLEDLTKQASDETEEIERVREKLGRMSNLDVTPSIAEGATPAPVAPKRISHRHMSLPTECEKRYVRQSMKLQLEVLALERVSISAQMLTRSIDWMKLTSITILHCENHEQLWRSLRKNYPPAVPLGSIAGKSKSTKFSSSGQTNFSRQSIPAENYPLKLKRIQTDAVSPQLISFIKEALAPDSLEWLFLQEGRPYRSNVSIESIYKGAIRRHRGSLRKLLIDSEDHLEGGQPIANHNWRRWMFNRETLASVTSGKMPHLRELGMSMEYKDWHFFLRRLPLAPQLRSLYIPYLADHVHGASLDSKELALQVLDIVYLQPDIELCYLGIQTKCFEILELSGSDHSPHDLRDSAHDPGSGDHSTESESESDDIDNAPLPSHAPPADEYSEPEFSDLDDDDSIDEPTDRKKSKQFKLREILFYDDKISVFKARHGKI